MEVGGSFSKECRGLPDYFVGLIFKVDARNEGEGEEGRGSIENFHGEKKEVRLRLDATEHFLFKSNFCPFFLPSFLSFFFRGNGG